MLAMRDEITAYFLSIPPATASAGTARPSSSPHNEGWLPVPILRNEIASSPVSLRSLASMVR